MPDILEITDKLDNSKSILKNFLSSKYNYCLAVLEKIENSSFLKNPSFLIEQKEQLIDNISQRLLNSFDKNLNSFTANFEKCVAKLDALSPLKVITRGYAVAQKNGKTISSVNEININDNINLIFNDGNINCKVNEIIKEKNYAKN